MKKLGIIAALVLLLPFVAEAQLRYTNGNITANGGCVTLSTPETGNGSFQTVGTFSATLAASGTNDGVNWVTLLLTPAGSTTQVTSVTTTGLWTYTGSYRSVRVCATAYTSGTATVHLLATWARAGGGGVGGAATTPGGSDGQLQYNNAGAFGGIAPTDDNILVGNGTAWQLKAITDCQGAGKAVTYTASSNTFGCNTISGGSVPGSDTQVVFNDGGSFGADADMTWDKTTNTLTILGTSIVTNSRATTYRATTTDLSGSSEAAAGTVLCGSHTGTIPACRAGTGSVTALPGITGDLGGTFAATTVNRASQDFSLTGIVTPSQITSSQNDYAPSGISTASTLRVSSDAARNITGFAAGQVGGRVLIIENVGSFAITLKNADTGSSTVNRILADADIVISANQTTGLKYDPTSSRWRPFGGSSVSDATIVTSDITTNDCSTTKHGWAPKGDNNTAHYLDGTCAWRAVPTGVGLSNTGAYSAIANTTAETYFAVGTDGKITAATLNTAGKTALVNLAGVYSTNGVTDSITVKVKLCTVSGCGSGTVVTMAATGAITPTITATNEAWSTEIIITPYTTGASGTGDAQGWTRFSTAAGTALTAKMANTSASTVDWTVDQYVSVSITWNNASANNTIALRDFSGRIGTTLAGGAGGVTSVAATVPTDFAISGSPITTSGTLAITASTQAPNKVYASPANPAASNAAPTMRLLQPYDTACYTNAWYCISEDFARGNSAVGTYNATTANISGSLTATWSIGTYPNIGQAVLTTGTSTGNGGYYSPWNNATPALTKPLTTFAGLVFHYEAIFNISATTSIDMVIGIHDGITAFGATVPANGCGVEFLTSTSQAAFNAFCANGGTYTRNAFANSGGSALDTAFHKFIMDSDGTTVTFKMCDSAGANCNTATSITTNLPTNSTGLNFGVLTQTTAARVLTLDFYSFATPMTR